MGWLESEGGERLFLGERTLVGRSPGGGLVIPRVEVSGEHASLRWSANGWQVKDLGSLNGTRVDGRDLEPGRWQALLAGSTLEFGGVSTWTLCDAQAPTAAAIPPEGEPLHAVDGLLAIPSSDEPECVIWAVDGRGWVIERDGDEGDVHDGDSLLAGGRDWTLRLPLSQPQTVSLRDAPPSLEQLHLRFQVSPDEEHVHLTATCAGRSLDLEARTFHYLLLILARARLGALDARYPTLEGGWVYQDDLAKWLGVDDPRVNMDVFRARKLLASKGIVGAAGVVERRKGTRQLRLGSDDLSIDVQA